MSAREQSPVSPFVLILVLLVKQRERVRPAGFAVFDAIFLLLMVV